ncbi:NAD(P)H-binding protein [Streptomyces sp. MUM 203J]|nr:NAD(P)H-binding protein [Streptomyces sp. MUM 203J]MCH0541919.1 NAD(P)H-binding protein [Streptomyces sp. MUM 203J]
MDTGVIAVTGAGGRVGRLVAARLSDRGVAPRLLARNPARLPDLPGTVKAPAAEYGDRAGMRAALDGADALLLVSAHESPARVAEHRAAVDAAVAAGVGRIVYLSFQGAGPDATFTLARDHWHTEQYIRAQDGLGFTFLRDGWYLAGIPAMTGSDGILRGPAGNGRVAAVAHEDVADVAAAVLLAPGEHDGATYDVTGGEAFTLAEAAEELSRATGRTIRYLPETRDEAYASRAGSGAPDWQVEAWVTSYEAIGRGELGAVSDTVPRLTGHTPMTLRDFLAEHPRSCAHLTG